MSVARCLVAGPGFRKRWAKSIGILLAALLLAACATHKLRPGSSYNPAPYGSGAPYSGVAGAHLTQVTWEQVDGWQDDTLIGAAAALRADCLKLARQPDWARACSEAVQIDELDPISARGYFERYFTPFQVINDDGSVRGLVTGYYEPELHGSRSRHEPYLYPLYRWPTAYARNASLPPRATLMRSGMLNGAELAYVDDPIEAFFLQIQGSGRILMDDGSVMRVSFGGTNNQPYKSIGTWLIEHRELSASQATMQGIRAWARANPGRVDSLLEVNPRFVFFTESIPVAAGDADGPLGALGVPLTPERSIAVDPSSIPLGLPVFLATTRPLSNEPLNQLVFAQDVGSAIKGGVRADFFWGLGDAAGDLAGKMKQAGRMWVLKPNP
jgi:membrane-bound lytic murein transglycosylase A